MLVTGPQLRAARAMAGLEQEQLAEASRVSANTIRRLESQNGPLVARTDTVRALQAALEAAGIEFTNADRPGVLERSKPAAEPAPASRPARRRQRVPAS